MVSLMGCLPDRFGRPRGDGLGGMVEQFANPLDFFRCPPAAMHVQRVAQVADRFMNLWWAVVAAQGALADFDAHAHAVQRDSLFGQRGAAGFGDGIKAFAALHLAADQLGLLEEVEGGVDHPGAWAVATVEQVFDLADQIVAVARLLGEQVQHQQLEVAGGKDARAALATAGAPLEGVMRGVFAHGGRAPSFAIYRKILLKIYLKTSLQLQMIIIYFIDRYPVDAASCRKRAAQQPLCFS